MADAQAALPTNDELTSVSALALRLQAKHEDKVKLEEQLTELNKQIRQLEVIDLPDAMTAAGNLTFFALSNGAEIEIKPYVEASIPRKDDDDPDNQKRRLSALEWLENNHPDILKHEVSMAFTKGEDKKVEKAIALLKKAGFDNVVDETTVHHATLKAFIKGQIAARKGVPMDLFKVDVGEKATVKLPKPKGTK